MKKSAFFSKHGASCRDFNAVYPPNLRSQIAATTQLLPSVITPQNFTDFAPELREVEVIFSTWGMWNLSPNELAGLPKLQAVFYGAGSVRYFAAPLIERGILVTSAWVANAVPVAEWTLGQILLANKGYWRNKNEAQDGMIAHPFRGRGNYGATVSVLGAGQIGRKLIELLRPFSLRVLAFDPFLSFKGAESLGVEKVELEEAFARGAVVTNHLADVPATVGLLNEPLLCAMPRNATFINTGRGATVNHADLEKVLRARPDLTALLDVTEPEPLPPSHPLRALPNVHLTSHIAGSIGDEVARMGQYAFDEFAAWNTGRTLRYAITLEMLETLA